uniref:HYDIN axonemal central pair apparatus protein n=1 Tax=Amphiprion percula TaxID=161767 RepID=A0A3P8U8F5_AMPPE
MCCQFSLVDVHQPLFQPYPSELIFQNFTPAQTYKLPLLLLNNDKVSRQVMLQQQDSEYFCVVGPEDPGRKVAPGLPATYTVSFTPQENKDYEHTIVCVTERERFEIPIRAIGPRAILDFRDEIHLPVCPVKSYTEKTHLVRNMGNSEAKFELRTQRPFSVTPSSGTLDVGESMQVTVVFHPMTTGDHRQDLLLHYHTGEDVYISLYGSCEELDIRLVPDSVWLTDTYISLANVHKVSVTNNSDTILQYCWTVSANQQEEDLKEEEEEEERERPVFQCDFDPVLHYLPLLSRALQECRTQAAKDCLLALAHSCIAVDPVEGEIWPGTTANFLIVFKPEEAKLYQQTVYCDITGRESRLPLTIKGEGLGPNVQLDYNLINVGNVFIGDKNQYEVQVSNRGLIDAPFKLSSPDTTSARFFSFSPEEGVVPPGACQIVKVTFHSHILGAFSEDLLLTVTGQPQPLTLTFRGSVVVPTFHLNVSELSFGDVPFGFPQTLSCTLFNTSFVPMTFALRVLGDGLGSPSVSAAKQVSEASRKTWQGHTARDLHALPAEFTVSPASNFVRAMSDVTFKVTLCSNTVKRYRLGLTVDVEGVGKEILTLPINARCVVPEIVVEPSVLDFQRCFLDHPYKQSVQLTNPSNMAACYGILDQVCSRMSLQDKNITQLQFGRIPVLMDVVRTLQLLNQSPVPAHFTARMSSAKSFWRVEPSEGEVPPDDQLELKVVAHLKDTLQFQNTLEVSIQDSRTLAVRLSATGTGTTIVSDEPLGPSLDLGTHFSHESCEYHFKLTNSGQRRHLIYWRNAGFPSSTKTRKGDTSPGRTFLPPIPTPRQRGGLNRGSLISSREKPMFSLSPARVELFPGDSVDMVLKGCSDSPMVVRERLVCQAIIGAQGSYEQIMSVDITCRFVAPVLSISSKELNFYLKKVGHEHIHQLNVITMLSFLDVHYPGHQQEDVVNLHAEVHFPNLDFSSTTVDFGCVFNCTGTCKVITITNCSPLPVSYRWGFLDDQKYSNIRYFYSCDIKFQPVWMSEGHLLYLWRILPVFFYVCLFVFVCQGYIDAGKEQRLRVLYLPGFPEVFEKLLQLQVAFLPPQDVTLSGVGVFPRISLNLPRNLCKHKYYEELLHMEIERLLVKENALAVSGSLLERRDSQGFSAKWQKLSKFLLPEYVLDFGYVILGSVVSHTVNVTNSGSIPVSFSGNYKNLAGTGFTAEFERVKNLPCGETQTFTVKFDPQGANVKMGDMSVIMLIQVSSGPMVQVRLRAVVTKPAVTTSRETLQFDTVQCGMCQMKTIQLLNDEPVPCYWSIFDKFLPLHKRKKILQEQRPPPPVFEMIPCSGLLSPCERVNVNVKFSPTEGHAYSRRLVVRVADSTQQVFVTAQGQGEEPQLEFCPSVLQLEPCLPFNTETEAEVTVKNPCSFPIEFYSLEYDTQYLTEEKILRLLQGYDENNTLLLPSRIPGEALPAELLDYYKDHCSVLKDDDETKENDTQEGIKESKRNDSHPEISTLSVRPAEVCNHCFLSLKLGSSVDSVVSELTREGSSGRLGQLEMTPVSRAVARHMGVDLSPESLAARNRRGIALIVHGAPLTGKNTAALARHYGAACLSVDAVVTDVLLKGTSPVSLRARQLYDQAAAEHAHKKAEEAGKHHILCLNDCHRGIVIAGLQSVYTQSAVNALQVVLKALNNRKHIYAVNLSDSYAALKARERAQREAECKLCTKRAAREQQWIQELDEEQYDALSEEAKRSITQRHLDVLDDLGLGPSGPPIPPPTTFSIVTFPKHREQATVQQTCFTFLVPSGPDEQGEEKEASEDTPNAVCLCTKYDETATSRSRNKGSIKESALPKDKDKKGRESQRSKRRTSAKTKAKGSDLPRSPSRATSTSDQDQHQGDLELKRSQSLTTFRWVVPAGDEVVLKIWFYSESPGKFEQTFSFELLGTQRRYQLTCRGVCTYPSICKDYTSVYRKCKVPHIKEGLQKTYVIKPGYFEFGPLLCSKTRDRYKENRYPKNTEKLMIHNNSGLEAEVQFCFQHDTQATTFLLDPPNMTLKPDQKRELTVWAYPTKVGQVKDSVVCQIKDNPELVVIDLSCWGVLPELELEKKHLHFDRILLYRTDRRSVMMHNKTALPVSWRLQGVEELGDEFTVPQDHGIITPNSSFPLSLQFRSRKPLHVKKILRLEVSDEEKIVGVVHTENIQVTAEAYDVALEISPTDGHLDFGTIRVFEAVKLSLKLKNLGKYEIIDPAQPKLDSIFTISPQSGTIGHNEKPTMVHVLCRPNKELSIREQAILPCQVIEPKIGKGGETIVTLNIKVSIQAVFSRYTISPACDISFGPLAFGTQKRQSFTIENTGFFEAHYTLRSLILRTHSKTHTISSPPFSPSYVSSMCPSQNRLIMGVFSVFPCTGTLQPGSQQQVTVDCIADQLGSWNQDLLIDISGRDPSDHPDGIPYRLLAEVCKPGIVLDVASIFEEHHLCHSSSQLSSEQFCNAECIYVLEENKFIFNKVLVGQTTQARFKFTNNRKIPCMLSLSIKYAGAKVRHINMEVFDLSATTLHIPNQSQAFAYVTFTPQAMQLYSAVFEVTVEGTRMTPTAKGKVLEFQVMGEGTLPSVCVIRPALRSCHGNPMLQFRRVLVGRRHTLPLVLLNDGNIPAQVRGNTLLCPVLDRNFKKTTKLCSYHLIQLQQNQKHYRSVLKLNVNESMGFEVCFCSDKPLSVKAQMSLQVKDNQYSDTTIQVTGEAYQELVAIDNIKRSSEEMGQEEDEEENYEVLNFGDCNVDWPYQESFTLINHSSSQVARFEWPPPGPYIVFSPQVGHLHAGCSKEVTVTFRSSQPLTLSRESARCKICQVEFQQPLEQVADWDDRKRTVQWLSSSKQTLDGSQQPAKNKVMKTDPEPSCSVVDGSQRELDLRISAVYFDSEYKCKLALSVTGGTSTPRPGSRSAGSRTGSRPPSALASVMSVLTGNLEVPPLSVEPNIGTIEPGATQDFSVCFSPLEVAQFQGKLLCSIPNLQDGVEAPSISVCGRSLLPHCHFDLEDSDYIRGNRRNPEFRSCLDPNTRVLELNAIGVSAPTTSVVNPTSKSYSFQWRCEDTAGSPFDCLTPCGTIQSGKKVEMCFEYVAEQLDVVESFWSFVIESLSVSVPFLCVGTTREPLVYLDRPHLDFGELHVGHKAEQSVDVVNGEEEPFNFTVLQSSLLCEDQQSNLSVQPMTGTVASKDRLPLSVSFTPSLEGNVSFRLVVRVKRKPELLALTVKADCFTMSASVQVQDPDGELREINLNHQDVGISEQLAFNFLVSNQARFTMEVNFDLTGPTELLQHLEAKPQNATIEVGKQLQSALFFCPLKICNLHDVRLNIKVKFGQTFTFAIKGRAVAPSLEFSFTKFNFGKCFLYCPGMVPPSRTLVISNKGKRDISIQCQFKNTAVFEMDFQPDILSPGAAMEVPVTFCPREARRYHEKLTFILSSSITKQVDISGQGVEMKLELEDPRHKKVKLGSLTLGQKVKKQVVLVNRSTPNNIPLLQDLCVTPAGELKLKSNGGSCNTEIQFSPRQHVAPFTAELQAEFAGLVLPLLTIEGCCQDVEVLLDPDHLSFGAVVQRCQTRKKIFIMNTGDFGARFQWKTESFPAELSIKPAKGYISPGTDVPFDVTFAPVELSNDIRYENLSCLVEGSSSPVKLTVTGSCIAASTNKEVLNFVCPVRSSQTQTLSVVNPTNQRCSIRPLIEGEQWRASPFVTFEPHQNKAFEITYQPLTMTADEKKHLGSVFLSFPDGTGMLYTLQGTADPPKAEDTLMHELPAKTHHTELLPVHNWLSRQQRFCVLLEAVKPDKPDPTVSLTGLKYIDVPALSSRDYEMSFFTYREGQYSTKVTFCNKVTGEYLFYLVTFKATSPGVLSTIELTTTARRAVSATVEVENPLTKPASFTTECKSLDISVPSQHTVSGQSKGVLSFDYQPLQTGESTARLTLSSSDLGFFHYDLLLRALPPPAEKAVHFTTSLGSSDTVPVKFINCSRFKTDYACTTDCSEFSVDKSVRASPGFGEGSEASVEVCFEPHQLGEVRGQLSLSSAIGGEYIFPLRGICLPPKAQGPFSIKAGRSISIPFKNVFLQAAALSFQVDNPCFTVNGSSNLPSKKTQNIVVSFEVPPEGPPGPWFGRLSISSQRSEGHHKPCSWIYYLKGYRPESG